MTNQFKFFNYEITDDPKYLQDKFGIPQELQEQLEPLRFEAERGGRMIIKQLNNLIEQYPQAPQLKNFLSCAYQVNGKIKKGFKVNQWLIREHPDYLYGKINQAYEYYRKGQYNKIPEVLGRYIELKDLCPERDCFHRNEVASFLRIAIRYFCATENFEAAKPRLAMLKDLDPDHPDTEEVASHMSFSIIKAGLIKADEKTDSCPEFNNQEIHWLYKNGLEIAGEKLEKILSLPRNGLISDLTAVLRDSIDRYEYFTGIAEKEGWQEDKMSFAIHAVFLLGELRATECLSTVLDTFRQGEEYLDFWYGDFLTGELLVPLYHLGGDQLHLLKEFVLSSGIYTFARSEVCSCLMEVARQQPHRKEEITEWFRELFSTLANTPEDETIIDSDFIALSIGDAVDLRAPELLPEIKHLYDLGYLSNCLCDPYEVIERDIIAPTQADDKNELLNIYERYRKVVSSWASYTEEEDEDQITDELLAHRESWSDRGKGSGTGHDPEPHSLKTPLKIGRNDPCPCGSEKKYKKCCLGKSISDLS